MTRVFVSYRRADASSEAKQVRDAIAKIYNEADVFLDTCSIQSGDEWPKEISAALRACQVAVVVIGKNWLEVDVWNRRRIDKKSDWVRREIDFALEHGKQVVPVLVQGARLPPPDVLPKSIANLTTMQSIDVRQEYWDHDIRMLDNVLARSIERPAGRPTNYFPGKPMEDQPQPLERDQVERRLALALPAWTYQVSVLDPKLAAKLPQEYATDETHELYRRYRFRNCTQAIEFMQLTLIACNEFAHHPRWENFWDELKVRFTTWGRGYRVTEKDIFQALHFDQTYTEFIGKKGRRPRSE